MSARLVDLFVYASDALYDGIYVHPYLTIWVSLSVIVSVATILCWPAVVEPLQEPFELPARWRKQ